MQIFMGGSGQIVPGPWAGCIDGTTAVSDMVFGRSLYKREVTRFHDPLIRMILRSGSRTRYIAQ